MKCLKKDCPHLSLFPHILFTFNSLQSSLCPQNPSYSQIQCTFPDFQLAWPFNIIGYSGFHGLMVPWNFSFFSDFFTSASFAGSPSAHSLYACFHSWSLTLFIHSLKYSHSVEFLKLLNLIIPPSRKKKHKLVTFLLSFTVLHFQLLTSHFYLDI